MDHHNDSLVQMEVFIHLLYPSKSPAQSPEPVQGEIAMVVRPGIPLKCKGRIDGVKMVICEITQHVIKGCFLPGILYQSLCKTGAYHIGVA